MKELKKGDFTGIYSSIDGKPLYFTGVYSCMEYNGMPCVFLATDLHNNLTFCRWSQQDLNKRGFTIPPEPVRISKTAMQMIQKAGAVIRWTTAAERKAANTDHKRMSAYIITTAAGDFYTTGTCADVREILKAAQAATEESTPTTEANQDTTTGAQDGPTTAGITAANETPTNEETAPQNATSNATTAETATERPETSTAAQDTTGSDTRPPRATEKATTGHAANTSTPANQEPGTAAKSRNNATPCDNTRHHATIRDTMRHPATLAKSPQDARSDARPNMYPLQPPKARHGPKREPAGIPAAAAQTGEKVLFPAECQKGFTFTGQFYGYPFLIGISKKIVDGFAEILTNKRPGGYQIFLQVPSAKKFFQKKEGRISQWEDLLPEHLKKTNTARSFFYFVPAMSTMA